MASTYRRDDAITSALAANKLDLRAVLSVVLGATAPLTVAAGVVATAFAVTNRSRRAISESWSVAGMNNEAMAPVSS